MNFNKNYSLLMIAVVMNITACLIPGALVWIHIGTLVPLFVCLVMMDDLDPIWQWDDPMGELLVELGYENIWAD